MELTFGYFPLFCRHLYAWRVTCFSDEAPIFRAKCKNMPRIMPSPWRWGGRRASKLPPHRRFSTSQLLSKQMAVECLFNYFCLPLRFLSLEKRNVQKLPFDSFEQLLDKPRDMGRLGDENKNRQENNENRNEHSTTPPPKLFTLTVSQAIGQNLVTPLQSYQLRSHIFAPIQALWTHQTLYKYTHRRRMIYGIRCRINNE